MTYKILVVDDDAAMRVVLERLLTRDGHQVTLAVNGAKALALLNTARFDLIITDLVMPDIEGLQLLREVRKRESPPKLIAMSGGGRGSATHYLELAKSLGAAATLEKPVTPQMLTDAIDLAFEPPPVIPSATGRELSH